LSPDAQMTVLLTGGHGFTGVYVHRALVHAGYRVVCLVQNASGQSDEVVGDLLDTLSLASAMERVKPDYVIHLAGIAFVGHSDPLDFYRVNVIGTMKLLQAAYDAGATQKKIVLASSSNVYGSHPTQCVSEDFPPSPVNHYAMSKLAMEHMSRTWLDRLPIVITRPFNYTGPGQSEQFLIPKIVRHFVRKEPRISLGNLEVEREFNDVRSVAYAYVKLMESALPGTVVNLCSGVGHRLLDVVQLLQEMTGHSLKVEVDPKLVRGNELRVLVGNPQKLNELVPEAPLYSLHDTLKTMIDAELSVSHS
jgi:nucleoside-diphosphate-sugar epimerase